MHDLASESETFDGESANLARWRSAMSDLSGYLDGKHYDESEMAVSGQYMMDILNNIDDQEAVI